MPDLSGITVTLYAFGNIVLSAATTEVDGTFALGAINEAYGSSWLRIDDPQGRYFYWDPITGDSRIHLGPIDAGVNLTDIDIPLSTSGGVSGGVSV